MGTILGLIILYEIIKPNNLKIDLSLKVRTGGGSGDHKSDD